MDKLVDVEKDYLGFLSITGFKVIKKKTKIVCIGVKKFTVSFHNESDKIVMKLVYDNIKYIATAYDNSYIVVTDLSNNVLFYLNRLTSLYVNFVSITKLILYGESKGNYLMSEVQFLYTSDISSVRMHGFYSDKDKSSLAKLKLLGYKCVGYRLEVICKSDNKFIKREYDVSCDTSGNYLSSLLPDKNKMFIVPLEKFDNGTYKNYYDSDSIQELDGFHSLYMLIGLLVNYC